MDPQLHAERVLCLVEQIPAGRVSTYGLIAEVIGAGGPRQVATVLRRDGGAVPWWRVVRADGTLPTWLRARAHGHYLTEGTPLRYHGCVDMARARWLPP